MIGAEPPSRIKGGGVLGGIAGGRPQELGEVTAYVLEKSPVRVLVTAPPDGAGRRSRRGHRSRPRAGRHAPADPAEL